MINVIDILFNLLPDLILLGGPFCVFAGMGTGSNTGKLNFKQICSSGGINITENSNSLDITGTVTGVPVGSVSPFFIAVGSGTGITPSRTNHTGDTKRLYGVSILGNWDPNNYTQKANNYIDRGMIIGGCSNRFETYQTKNSVILGGRNNKFQNSSGYYMNGSIILNSIESCFRGGCDNSIINSNTSMMRNYTNYSYESCINSIINSVGSYQRNSNLVSPITKSGGNSMFNSYSALQCNNFYTSIMSGCEQRIRGNCYSVIFNGDKIRIEEYSGANVQATMNVIINGRYNCIKCGNIMGNLIVNGLSGEIITDSNVDNAKYNTIISGCLGFIRLGQGFGATCQGYNTIISGRSNVICYRQNQSSILNSYGTGINMLQAAYTSDYKGIFVSNSKNLTSTKSSWSAIFGTYKNDIHLTCYVTMVGNPGQSNMSQAKTSTIIGSNGGSIKWEPTRAASAGDKVCGNTIIGGVSNLIHNNFTFISGLQTNCSTCIGSSGASCHNFIHGIRCNSINMSRYSSILGGYCKNRIVDSIFSTIIGGQFATVSNTDFSVVLSGRSNMISDFSCMSTIIGGRNNCIIGGSINSAIVGSQCSQLVSICNGVIIGGNSFTCRTSGCSFTADTLNVCQLQMFGTASVGITNAFCQGVTCASITSFSQIRVCRGIVVSITP